MIRTLRSLPRPERLLPAACVAAAAVLFASELMTAFEFVPAGGEAVSSQSTGDRHEYALALLAGFAIGAVVVALLAASKPAAVGVGIVGAAALIIFLVNDLPDAGQVGAIEDNRQSFPTAEAVPQEGFWLGLVGSVGLAISGLAFATLNAQQLGALRPAWLERISPGGAPEAPEPEARDEARDGVGVEPSEGGGAAEGPERAKDGARPEPDERRGIERPHPASPRGSPR